MNKGWQSSREELEFLNVSTHFREKKGSWLAFLCILGPLKEKETVSSVGGSQRPSETASVEAPSSPRSSQIGKSVRQGWTLLGSVGGQQHSWVLLMFLSWLFCIGLLGSKKDLAEKKGK